MTDIKTISTEELLKDLEESRNDVSVCDNALTLGVTEYSGGLVKDRLSTNLKIIEKIKDELARRNQPEGK